MWLPTRPMCCCRASVEPPPHQTCCVVLAIHVCRATSLWLHIRCPPTIAIQAANSISIALYIFGIPVFFFAVLWKAAMPQSNQTEWDSKDPYMGRFGMLYASYHPRCWWWELLELVRKLILTGVIVFVGTGTVSQSWFAMITAQFFLLMMTRFQPYGVKQIDHLSFVAQVGCFWRGATHMCYRAVFSPFRKPPPPSFYPHTGLHSWNPSRRPCDADGRD